MGIAPVGGNSPGGNCPGGNSPAWELAGWEFTGWELPWWELPCYHIFRMFSFIIMRFSDVNEEFLFIILNKLF